MISLYTVFHMFIPLICGGVLHMVAVRFDLFNFLKIPLNKQKLGENKTLRGFVLMPLFCILGTYLTQYMELHNWLRILVGYSKHSCIWGGFLLGFMYMLFELPNSWIKRRLNIT